MLTTFDHVTIAVAELESACARYAQLLGREPSARGHNPELDTESALFGLGNSLVELVAPRGEGAEGLRAWLEQHGEGLQAIAFGTPDAQLASETLRARGVRATPPQPGRSISRSGTERSYRTVELSPRTTRGLSVFLVERPDFDALRGADVQAAPDAIEALDHVVVRTADPDAALAFYRDALGLRLSLDRTFGATRMLFLRVGKVTLELVHDEALGPSDAFFGLAYRCRDLDGAHARLAAAGFSPGEPRAGRKPGTRVFTLHDAPASVPTLFVRDPSRDPT